MNAYLEKFSNNNFKVTKLIDTDSSSYFYLVLSPEKEFFKNVRNCLEKHKIVADKAIRVRSKKSNHKALRTLSREKYVAFTLVYSTAP